MTSEMLLLGALCPGQIGYDLTDINNYEQSANFGVILGANIIRTEADTAEFWVLRITTAGSVLGSAAGRRSTLPDLPKRVRLGPVSNAHHLFTNLC